MDNTDYMIFKADYVWNKTTLLEKAFYWVEKGYSDTYIQSQLYALKDMFNISINDITNAINEAKKLIETVKNSFKDEFDFNCDSIVLLETNYARVIAGNKMYWCKLTQKGVKKKSWRINTN